MFRYFRWRRARKLLRRGNPRRIRVHSVTPVPEGSTAPRYYRVAFEFLDRPGPWSIQFYEAAPGQEKLIAALEPGARAGCHESGDGKGSRVLLVGGDKEEQRPLMPR